MVYCKKCGKKIEDVNSVYCQNCGKLINQLDEEEKPHINKSTIKAIIIAIVVIIIGASGYYGYNMFKTNSFNQKVDSLMGQYSISKSNAPFQEVLRAFSNPQQTNSFEEFKSALAQAKQDSYVFSVYYNSVAKVIYCEGYRLNTNELNVGDINYMIYYIDS